jgi:hypothetical protein
MRLTPGTTISTISQEYWLSLMQAAKCFGMGTALGPVAAQFSHIQLWNPVGSGKTLLVRHVLAEMLTAGTIYLRADNVARATFDTNGNDLNLGAGGSAAEIHTENNAALQGSRLGRHDVLASVETWWDDGWVAVITPGNGLNVIAGIVNVNLSADFTWAEI